MFFFLVVIIGTGRISIMEKISGFECMKIKQIPPNFCMLKYMICEIRKHTVNWEYLQ